MRRINPKLPVNLFFSYSFLGFPGGLEVNVSARNAGDPGSIPGLGRSLEEATETPVLLPGESYGQG